MVGIVHWSYWLDFFGYWGASGPKILHSQMFALIVINISSLLLESSEKIGDLAKQFVCVCVCHGPLAPNFL